MPSSFSKKKRVKEKPLLPCKEGRKIRNLAGLKRPRPIIEGNQHHLSHNTPGIKMMEWEGYGGGQTILARKGGTRRKTLFRPKVVLFGVFLHKRRAFKREWEGKIVLGLGEKGKSL